MSSKPDDEPNLKSNPNTLPPSSVKLGRLATPSGPPSMQKEGDKKSREGFVLDEAFPAGPRLAGPAAPRGGLVWIWFRLLPTRKARCQVQRWLWWLEQVRWLVLYIFIATGGGRSSVCKGYRIEFPTFCSSHPHQPPIPHSKNPRPNTTYKVFTIPKINLIYYTQSLPCPMSKPINTPSPSHPILIVSPTHQSTVWVPAAGFGGKVENTFFGGGVDGPSPPSHVVTASVGVVTNLILRGGRICVSECKHAFRSRNPVPSPSGPSPPSNPLIQLVIHRPAPRRWTTPERR